MAVCSEFEWDNVNNMYKCKLFQSPFIIPLSLTSISPFDVYISPCDHKKHLPEIWVDLVDRSAEHALWDRKLSKPFKYTLLNGQSEQLVATRQVQDTSFATDDDERMHLIYRNYKSAFSSFGGVNQDFSKFFAFGFALSLPYITEREAATSAIKNECKQPFEKCLAGIWQDYQATDAFKKTNAL
jgi:hypothetical protein